MPILTSTLTTLISILHIYILILETILWTTPRGRRAFNLTPEFAEKTKALAQSQGVYNGFLAAGLLWGVVHPDPAFGTQLRVFFLCCVFIAGVFGAATANVRILFVQGLPAFVALLAHLL